MVALDGITTVVNAAGIIRLKPILEFTVQDIRDIYAINVEATWDLTSRIGRTMPSGGSIVNLSSSSAKLATTTEAAGTRCAAGSRSRRRSTARASPWRPAERVQPWSTSARSTAPA